MSCRNDFEEYEFIAHMGYAAYISQSRTITFATDGYSWTWCVYRAIDPFEEDLTPQELFEGTEATYCFEGFDTRDDAYQDMLLKGMEHSKNQSARGEWD